MRDIKELRGEIDTVDSKILTLVEKRVRIAKKIGDIKKTKQMPTQDKSREEEIINQVSSKTSLDKKFVKKVFRQIIDYCRLKQGEE